MSSSSNSSSSSSSSGSSDQSSSSEADAAPSLVDATSKAHTDTESISDASLRTNEIGRTAISEPLSPRGAATPVVRMKSIRIDTAKHVDEVLQVWSGGDASVSNPFPGIKLHKHESREELFERAMSSWAGSDWQKKDAEVEQKVKKKHASQKFVPKAFPGVELHDERVQDLRDLPGARATAGEAAIVPKVSSFPNIPIHDESEDLSQLPGAKKKGSALGSPGSSPPASPSVSPPASPHVSPPASPPVSPRSSSRKDRKDGAGGKKTRSLKKSSSPKASRSHMKPPAQ